MKCGNGPISYMMQSNEAFIYKTGTLAHYSLKIDIAE